jgi:hypothetical protein
MRYQYYDWKRWFHHAVIWTHKMYRQPVLEGNEDEDSHDSEQNNDTNDD